MKSLSDFDNNNQQGPAHICNHGNSTFHTILGGYSFCVINNMFEFSYYDVNLGWWTKEETLTQ